MLQEKPSTKSNVLVVDDNSFNRLKMRKAVEFIGHHVEVCDSGESAFQILGKQSFDAILLDIIMPEMDGFEVLQRLKEDAGLRDIPVIIISALDDEILSVVKAIELGAEDFLPKDFDAVLLKARLNASLEKKRFRDQELEYLSRVERLTATARVLESGSYTPDELELDDLAAKKDALGRLAHVFQTLAIEVYERESRLDRTARTLRGALMLLAAGGIFGLGPALGRMAAGTGSYHPLGIVFWASIVSAIFCLSISFVRSGFPRIAFKDLKFFVLWAIVLGCLYQIATIVISANTEATIIALVGSSRAFMVFGLAALLGLERPSLRRFLGLGVGFAAIVAVLVTANDSADNMNIFWVAAALLLPLLLAIHTLLMTWRPAQLDAYATVGIMMVLTAVMIAPFAIALDAVFWPQIPMGQIEIIIVLLGISTAMALAIALNLVKTAGAVFASQMAYSQTIAGILWGMLLLDETLTAGAWAALVLVILGFWLVEPRRAARQFRAKVSFERASNRDQNSD